MSWAEHPVGRPQTTCPWAMRDLVGYDMNGSTWPRAGSAPHGPALRLREGGVGAQFWSVFVPPSAGDAAVTATLNRSISSPDDRSVCRGARPRDVGRRRRRGLGIGRIASPMGRRAAARSIPRWEPAHVPCAQVRYLTLTHNDNVPWADSATDEPVLGGLSDFGRDVVREDEPPRMLVDCSHVSADDA